MIAAQLDVDSAIESIENAFSNEKLTAGAVENIREWLTNPSYAKYLPELLDHIAAGKWEILDDVFWTIIPFGTGGRRGKMYPIGSNAINERTIGESAAGLASYVLENAEAGRQPTCAIAYDTRHRSVEFSKLCAEIMVAAGFKVYYLDEFRATPELSFMIRAKQCDCGIMVTASHNPPSDNAVKCYWSTGGQILPPHDRGVIDRVMKVAAIERSDFDQAVETGRIEICTEEIDNAYISEISKHGFEGPRDLSIVYSPLHGVGATATVPVLRAVGFNDVEVYARHAEPSGDFPNVPDNVSNPENAAVFDEIIEYAKQNGKHLALASDPDCDRLGCAAPLTLEEGSDWKTIDGNSIGALLTDYVLRKRKEQGTLNENSYVVKTSVTTELVKRIADSYGVKTFGDLLVGFKWIGGEMDLRGPGDFVLGTEESHGYLVGQYARDKDGAVAAMLLSEMAADAKAKGKTLHQCLEDIHLLHGVHCERLMTQKMPGSEGMSKMKSLMQELRENPPQAIGEMKIAAVKDYQSGTRQTLDSKIEKFDGPAGNMVILEFEEEGNYLAARPSGTEPKVKFYAFTYERAKDAADVETVRGELKQKIDKIESALNKFVSSF